MIDAAKLKQRRESVGLSRGKLSQEAGLARNVVGRIESGQRGDATQYATLVSLARVLGCEPKDLTVDTEDEAPVPEVDWRFG